MKRKGKALLLAIGLVAQLAVGVVTATSAHAATGPADDREQTAPVNWWTYTGVTASQIGSELSANHARLTEIQVANPSTPTFTVVMVSNSGSYASGYWWYYGETQAQVSSLLSTNSARLISADAYSTSSGVRYAVVMVPNSGSNAKGWAWYVDTTANLSTDLSNNHMRMIQVSPYPGSSTLYLAIMVDNTGNNATGWWWYVHASVSSINTALNTNHARIEDLSLNSDGTYNVVMYTNPSTRWYWYVGQNPATALQRAVQQGERIIDVTSYVSGNATLFNVVETRNTNAASEKLYNIIAPTVDSGSFGFYLKKVGGSELAGLEENAQYEPASALKVLYHAYSIHEESIGASSDGNSITYHYDPNNPSNQGICPDNFPNTATTSLINADEQMMWNSDNRMTKGIVDNYGLSNILNYASSLGLTATEVHHDIGCPTPSTHNLTTLADLGKVYEAFQQNVVTNKSAWKTQFKNRMLNQTNYSGFESSICPIVNQVAQNLGKSQDTATAFCNAMTWIAKGGSYQYGGALPYNVSWDGLSMTGVPFKDSSGTIARHSFVFGEYVDETQINSQSEADAINAARAKEYQEAMRPYIRSALQTWT